MPVASTTPRENTPRKIIDAPATMRSLNCSRWKLWDLCRNDDDFPAPRMIAGKRAWFMDEIETYKESRPCRVYTTIVAVIVFFGAVAHVLANYSA